VTPVNNGVDLYWDTVEGATGYVILMARGDSQLFTVLSAPTGKDNTIFWAYGLENGPYSFFVAPTDAFGLLGGRTSTISATPGRQPRPSATQLWAQPGDGQVTLRWMSLPSAAYYDVWMKTEANADYTTKVCGTRSWTTNCTVPELVNGTTYYFAVEGGNSDYQFGNPLSNTVQVSPNMTVLRRSMVPEAWSEAWSQKHGA
jgi:hypothetical protein